MYCIKCGQVLQETDSFCSRCGTPKNYTIPQVQPRIIPNEVTKSYPRRIVNNNKTQLYGLLLTLFVSGTLGLSVGVAGLSDCKFYDKKGKGFAVFNIVFGIVFGFAKLALLLWFLVKWTDTFKVDPEMDEEYLKIIFKM